MPKADSRQLFFRERARYLLAHEWCPSAGRNNGVVAPIPQDEPSWEIAISRGWISSGGGRNEYGTVNKAGWEAATAFLKR